MKQHAPPPALATIMSSLMIWLLTGLPVAPMSAQPGLQWTSTSKVPPNNYDDWLYDVIVTSSGNYLGVGFAHEGYSANPRQPAYIMVSPAGTLLRDGVLGPAQGEFWNVVEAGNAYYAVGYRDVVGVNRKGLLTKIDKSTLDAVTFELQPAGYERARLREVLNVKVNGQDQYLLIAGFAQEATSNDVSYRWLAVVDYNGNIQSEHVFPHSAVGEEIKAMQYEVMQDGRLLIYVAAETAIQLDGGFNSHRRHDFDITVTIIEYDPTSGNFTETYSAPFNSIHQGPRDTIANATTKSSDIFHLFPPDNFMDEYPYGPKYLNTPIERAFQNCNESPPVKAYYVEDWSDGSEDFTYSLELTEDYIVVSALLNRLLMWPGTNHHLGGDGLPGLRCNEGPCFHYDSPAYMWGEAYLLFIRKSDLGLEKATHLGTMSGGDFQVRMTRTSDGGFAVVGTVAGCPDGLAPVDGDEHIMVIKLDANGDVAWRKHFNGPADGACGFSIAEAPGGGLVVVGNTEGGGTGDAYLIASIGSSCDYSTADIVPNSGQDHIVQSSTTWNTDRYVLARVVVPDGVTLTIEGPQGTPITIRFADSREVFDFEERQPIGIAVQKGGRLIVRYATLTGWDCATEKMWDGIAVSGDASLDQTTANQGYCDLLAGAVVQNARLAATACPQWISQPPPFTQSYAGTGTQTSLSTSRLEHGGSGGARIRGTLATFRNNARDVVFMKYQHNKEQSRFLFTDFVSDGPYVDPAEIANPVPGVYDYTERKGTAIHASIWHTRVSFQRCNFSGNTDIAPGLRPVGIIGYDAKIHVTSSNMNDLKVGIESTGPLGGLLANLYAQSVTFDNCIQGINLRSSISDIIQNCTFDNIPGTATFDGLRPVGIFSQLGKATSIYNNDFTGADPANPSWGLVVHNSHNHGAYLSENTFDNTLTGNQFEGNNAELSARCNDYLELIGKNAWSVLLSENLGVLGNQGSQNINLPKADNRFFAPCDNDNERHIKSQFAFNYYDKTGNPYPPDPDCVSDTVNLVIFPINAPLDCLPDDPPCDTPDCWEEWANSQKTLLDRNRVLLGLLHPGLDENDELRPANYTDALAVLADRGQPEDKMLRIGTLAGLGEFAQARYELDLLAGTTDELAAFMGYMAAVLDSGEDLMEMPKGDYEDAIAHVEETNTSAIAMAQALHHLRGGVYHPLVPLTADSLDYRSSNRSAAAEAVPSAPGVTVSPNPFSSTAVFDLGNLSYDALYNLDITDLSGRVVWSKNGIANKGRVAWDAAALPDGIYFYRIHSDLGVRLALGKLVKINK